jgi:hypothetical protein
MIWRGELAGYTGTLVLEEVDEDEHVARYRFQGIRDGATATATVRVAAGEITAEVHPGHRSRVTADELAAAAREALAEAAAAGGEAPNGAAAGGEAAVNAGVEPPPAPHETARRRRALVAAGAAAALAAWALRGRQ